MQDQESFAEKTAEPMQISAQDAVDSHLECVKYMTIYVKLGETILIYIYIYLGLFIPLQEALPDQTVEIPHMLNPDEQKQEESFRTW